ncbi:MAG: type II secretion system protein [Clostridia bacterium]|nr:type II secretion system protein [Clostridia bacterium]
MKKSNNLGFSLIELIAVTAIILIAAGVAGGAVSSALHARSYKAAKTIDAMIAQSKVNALSGTKNCLIIKFDTANKCYNCELHEIKYNSESGTFYDVDEAYDVQDKIGNDKLHISCGETDILSGGQIRLEFSMDTGRVKSLKSGDTLVLGTGVSDTTADIVFNFYSPHTIKIYKSTGEHELL